MTSEARKDSIIFQYNATDHVQTTTLPRMEWIHSQIDKQGKVTVRKEAMTVPLDYVHLSQPGSPGNSHLPFLKPFPLSPQGKEQLCK